MQRWCAVPAAVLFAAFWMLPMVRLALLPAAQGWHTYFAVLTEPRYLTSLVQTTVLSIVVTLVSLVIAAAVGVYLGRRAFRGRALLLSLLTLPLSFPGVIVGFFVILTGGRQGTFANLTEALVGSRITFAYSVVGLFLAYVYFSLPRAIAAFTAAAESFEGQLDEAARSLGASAWQIARDVWLPALSPTAFAAGAMLFATSMGAFGTAFTLASRYEVLPITIYNEFTNYANFALAASLSLALGVITWLMLAIAQRFAPLRSGRAHEDSPMSGKRIDAPLLMLVTAAVAIFTVAPILLSITAGLVNNFNQGLASGLTAHWLIEVWSQYGDTAWHSVILALICVALVVAVGVPCAYALARSRSRWARVLAELITLPVAVPGLASALALILAYGDFRAFRQSFAFILVGHFLFTLPFMVRLVTAAFARAELVTLEEAARSLGARFSQRFLGVLVPAVAPSIVAGCLTVFTLSMGEFNLTWMLHTPLTRTLPVGLADSYASMRIEIGSAYTLVFLLVILPVMWAMQWTARFFERRYGAL